MGVKENAKRKCIAFDMDTNALKKHYKDGDWHNAYNEIGLFLSKNGFKRIQGSVYDSLQPMQQAELNNVLDNLTNNIQWFAPCVKSIRAYDRPKIVDYTAQIKEKFERIPIDIKEIDSKESQIQAMKEKIKESVIKSNKPLQTSKDKSNELDI